MTNMTDFKFLLTK